MAHFYGTIQGSRGEASRLGGKNTGLQTTAASWHGAVRTVLYVDDKGRDCARVSLTPWQGRGISRDVFEGPVDGSEL